MDISVRIEGGQRCFPYEFDTIMCSDYFEERKTDMSGLTRVQMWFCP